MNDVNNFIQRSKLEDAEGWRGIVNSMPAIQFPHAWKVKVIPPFAGAVARFIVELPSGSIKSIYCDFYDRLGIVGEPYWEVYPYEDDVGRCFLNDVDELLRMIADESGEQQ